MTSRPLEGQVALVTGASRGIGYQCALAYARAGAHIVAVARTVGGLEELDDEVRAAGSEATLVPLDLRDGPGVDRLGPALAARFGKLDILLGNAGILGPQTPIAHLADKDWSEAIEVNLTANMRLLRGLDPLLRAAPGGRALFVTSGMVTTAPAYLAAYSVTKAGLGALVRTYSHETAQTNVTANLLSPGPLRTHMRARYLPGEDRSTVVEPAAFAETLVGVTEASASHNAKTWDFQSREWT